MHKQFFLAVFFFLSSGCSMVAWEEGREVYVDTYVLKGAGELKVTYKKKASGPMGRYVYGPLPMLYYNGRLIESEYPLRENLHTNDLPFPIDPEVLKTIAYADFREFQVKKMPYSPGSKEFLLVPYPYWYIYVEPDNFTKEDYDNIVRIYQANREKIDAAVSKASERYDAIGVIAYTKELDYEVFTANGWEMKIHPNGKWFDAHGGAYGKWFFEDGKKVIEIYYNKAYKPNLGGLYDPDILGSLQNSKGEQIKDLFELIRVKRVESNQVD